MYGTKRALKIWAWAESSREVLPPARIVATEKFEDPWYPGESVNSTEFTEDGEITRTRITVRYEIAGSLQMAGRSGMEKGIIAGYNRLEELLASISV